MAKKAAGGTRATAALLLAGIPFELREYTHDPAETDYGGEAARKLQLPPGRVFKTLVADVEGARSGGALTVAIVPVAGMLDLKALAAARGGKRAQLADPALAERKTGYVIGGISPIGQRTQLPTVLDQSALEYATVLVSGGKRGFDVELSPQDLLRVTSGVSAPIARNGTS